MTCDASNGVVLELRDGRVSLLIEIEADLENGRLTTVLHQFVADHVVDPDDHTVEPTVPTRPHSAHPASPCAGARAKTVSPMGEESEKPRLIDSLQRSFAAVEAIKVELLSQEGILPAHYALLMNVQSHPGITRTNLARLLGVTHQNVSALVARLTGRGWLDVRTPDEHPHVLELHLTGQGLVKVAEADRLIAFLEARLIVALGDDAATALRTALNQVRDITRHRSP